MNELTQYKERLHVALTAAKICIFEVDIQKQPVSYTHLDVYKRQALRLRKERMGHVVSHRRSKRRFSPDFSAAYGRERRGKK